MTEVPWVMLTATLLGAAGLGMLLPRGGWRTRMAGAALSAAALGALVSRLPGLGSLPDNLVFHLLAAITVGAAVATISFRNPVYCAIWFGMTLLGTAGLFLFQGAQFLAVATIVVYAGAILVTFLFVLMLADPKGRAPYDRVSWEALVSAATGAVIIGVLSMLVSTVLTDERRPQPPILAAAQTGSDDGVLAADHVSRIGRNLFGRHLIAVEVAGTLLLVALVGAAVIVGQARGALEGVNPKSEAPRGNPKYEARNPRQIQNPNSQ